MHTFFKRRLRPDRIAYTGTLLLSLSLTTSRAGMSIAMGLVLLAAVWHASKFRQGFRFHNPLLISLFMLYMGLYVLTAAYTEDIDRWVHDLGVKMPLLLLPLAYGLLPAFDGRQYRRIVLSMAVLNSLLAAACIAVQLYQLGGWSAFNTSSGYVPMLTDINHIYFSVILSFSLLAGIYAWNQDYSLLPRFTSRVIPVVTLLGIISLHLIKSRTGVLAFYAGAAVMSLHLLRTIDLRRWMPAFGLMTALLLLLFLQTPVLQHRLTETLNQSIGIEDPASPWEYSSIALRYEAWQQGWHLFQQDPLWGIGTADIETHLLAAYEQDQYAAHPSLWLDSAHNQYLEQLMGTGIIGFLFLIVLLSYPLYALRPGKSLQAYMFVSIMITAMLTESMLERQIGIGFFVLFMMIYARAGTEKTFDASISPGRLRLFRKRLSQLSRAFPFL